MKSKLSLSRLPKRKDRIVIVGAGLAGLRAAERLRELDFAGELVIIGAERRRPYHRPALSKQMLTGELRPRDLTLHSYVPLDAIWRRGTQVLKLDHKRHVIELPGDEEVSYDGLIIATGVQAKHMPGAPRHDPRVHVLRTMGDAIAVQQSIRHGNGKVVVIGGGFTSCEVASTAHDMGCDVTLLSRSNVLMGKVLGDELGNDLLELHRNNGIRVETGVKVDNWMCQDWGVSMHLSNGKMISATTVVLAVGSTPAVQWLRGSGLTLEDGVLCRPTCHVVGAKDVVAAGDCARWPNLRFEAAPRRVEHWTNAIDMGRAAAENLLIGEGAKPFTPLPRFWSEQHGLHIQAAGMPALSQETIPLARRKDGKGITGYIRNGRLIGIIGQDNPRGMLQWTEELKRELRRPETITASAIDGEPSLFEVAQKASAELEQDLARELAEQQPQAPRPNPAPAPRSRPVLRRAPRPLPDPQTVTDRMQRPQWVDGPGPGWSESELTMEHPTLARFFAELAPVFDEQNQSRRGMQPVQRPQPQQDQSTQRGLSLRDIRPVPRPQPPSRQNMPPVPPPPSRQNMPPVPPPPSRQNMEPVARQPHPSMPNMAPVARPPHPSMPGMTPVPPPPSRQNMAPVPPPPPPPSRQQMQPVPRPELNTRPHPSLRAQPVTPPDRESRHMQPVSRPHPSMPNMEPMARPLPAFPDMPRLAEEPFLDEHPSFPNMFPVDRPMSEFERRREQQMLEWQFRQ